MRCALVYPWRGNVFEVYPLELQAAAAAAVMPLDVDDKRRENFSNAAIINQSIDQSINESVILESESHHRMNALYTKRIHLYRSSKQKTHNVLIHFFAYAYVYIYIYK